MAPRKDTEQSDDWRNQAGQTGQPGQGNQKQGDKQGNQQSDQERGNKQSDVGKGERQGGLDDLEDDVGGQRSDRGSERGGRDRQR